MGVIALLSDMDVTAASPFLFMRLPPEIRLMIYKEILVFKTPLVVAEVGEVGFSHPGCIENAMADSERGAFRTKGMSPSDVAYLVKGQQVCSTSFQIYKEAMPIYFRFNSFRFHNFHTLTDFFRWIGKEARKNIRKIYFDYFGGEASSAFTLLAQCERLEHLVVTMTAQSLVGAPKANRVPVKAVGMRHLLKLRGIKTLEVEWLGPANSFSPETRLEFVEALQVLHQPRKTLTRRGRRYVVLAIGFRRIP